jgi:hypothetical protein
VLCGGRRSGTPLLPLRPTRVHGVGEAVDAHNEPPAPRVRWVPRQDLCRQAPRQQARGLLEVRGLRCGAVPLVQRVDLAGEEVEKMVERADRDTKKQLGYGKPRVIQKKL